MQTRLLLVSLSLAIAACGGPTPSSPSTPPATGGGASAGRDAGLAPAPDGSIDPGGPPPSTDAGAPTAPSGDAAVASPSVDAGAPIAPDDTGGAPSAVDTTVPPTAPVDMRVPPPAPVDMRVPPTAPADMAVAPAPVDMSRPPVAVDMATPPPGPGALGAACSSASQCGSGFCVEGVCCNTACNDAASCQHCAVARGAFANGTCTAAAELPRATVDVSAMPSGLAQHVLADTEELQQVIDALGPGVEIVVPATRTFGPITLPSRPAGNTRWTVIRSGSPSLPAPGRRVTKADAAALPKIRAPAGTPALSTVSGATYYWIAGFELAPDAATWSGIRNALVRLGDGGATAPAADHVVLDRLYIHGEPGFSSQTSTGVEMNGSYLALVNSHLGEVHTNYVAGQCTGGCTEAQGVVGWNGSGPYLVDNDYIASSSHHVFFGGDESASDAQMPRDITITRNHLHKPWSWYRGQQTPRYQTKTTIELKVGERVLIDGNYVENSWNSTGTLSSPQIGHALVLSPRNGDSAAISPWSTTRNVKVRNNKVVNACRGMSIDAEDDRPVVSGQTRCVDVVNNLFDQMPGQTASQDPNNDGRFMTVVGENVGVAYLTVDHNTVFSQSEALVCGYTTSIVPNPGFAFRDNLVVAQGGIAGDGTNGGTSTFKAYFPGADFRRNDMVGQSASTYGACTDYANMACTFFSPTESAVQVAASGESFPLASSSPDMNQCSHLREHPIGVYDWGATGTGRADAARIASDMDQ